VLEEVIYGTSRYCPNGNCVEAAPLPNGGVAIRDSKDRGKPPHIFTPEEWAAFIAGVKDGDFDFPHHPSQPDTQSVGTYRENNRVMPLNGLLRWGRVGRLGTSIKWRGRAR
jgi:hypothetical protein